MENELIEDNNEEVTPLEIQNTEYYVDPRIKKIFQNKIMPSLQKKDKDCIIAIDGGEGSGKSTLAFQLGKLADPTLNLNRVVFDAETFRQVIFKAKKGQCVIYDEAFTGLSSRSSLSGINRALVSLMMQMRQKNLLVIIVLPTFFLLDKYVALFRTRALFHVYELKGKRGYYKVYNRKSKKNLFLFGRQTYSYLPHKIKANIRKCRFYGKFALGDEEVNKKYISKKAKALEDTEKTPMSAGQVKYREQRDILIYLLRKKMNLKYQEMANLLGDFDLEMSFVQLRNICAKFGDKGGDEELIKTEEPERHGEIKVKKLKREKVVEKIEKEGIKEPIEEESENNLDDSEELIDIFPES